MGSYVHVIVQAIILFPIIALIISVPFILIQYHKYGSISFVKSLITYSFVLYLMCAYFLIILPLPSWEEVALLTTQKIQLIPFKFIYDFITHTSFNILEPITYVKFLLDSCFYVPIYNILLTLPFGIYLRYYFKCDMKKTIKYTFLLSLFFELTQLSGLYFIYPRGYRLFDIDDLMLNTIGGILGYLLCGTFIKYLPKRETIEKNATEKGKKISGLKRSVSFCLDLFIFVCMYFCIYLIFSDIYTIFIAIFLYYVMLPFILKGSTLSEKYLNLRIVNMKDKNNIINLFFRKLFFVIIYFLIPIGISFLISRIQFLNLPELTTKILIIVLVSIIFLIYAITVIKFLFTNKRMIYEKISKTKMISTIK